MIGRVLVAVVAVASLAACTSPRQQQLNRMASAAERTLARAGSIGDPGRVAAADFAFARMARDEGTWTAFRAYAAPDAMMDAPGGFAAAAELLAGRADPAEPIRWAPTDVWSSCDGTLAVSQGRFVRPNGLVGDYVTVWELQADNSYKWVYDTGTPDDPQPVAEPDEELPEDAIVVPGMTAIEGRVADCRPGERTDPPAALQSDSDATLSGVADDATLSWLAEAQANGSHRVRSAYLREATWETVVDLTIPADR